MNRKYKKKVSFFRRHFVTVVFRNIPCGCCSACLSYYRLPCLHPRDLHFKRNIYRYDIRYANKFDGCSF